MVLATSAWRESLARSARIQNFELFDKGRNLLPGGKPMIDRSHLKIASKRRTASSAIGETMTGLLVLAFVAISAKMKNFLLACAQHADLCVAM